MKETHSRTQVAATRSPGLHNDFSDQEESMTRSAMPPKFALTAGAAADADLGKAEDKPQLNITGVPPELVVMLEHFEGIRWNVYEDQLGNLTGGMGHLIKADEKAAFPDGAVISHEQVQAWAQEDVTAAWQRAQEQSAELGVADHDFYVAMASMCFQNGLYWNTKHVKTWALMKEHKWEEAALECADSDWARETPTRVPGFQAALRSQIAGGASPAGTSNVETHIAEPFRKRADAAKAGGKSKESKADAPQSKTEKSTAATTLPEGKEGMKQVQTKLQALGLYSGKIDGIATSSKGESNTTKGIKQFQQSQGLPVTGEVDAATWAVLGGGRKPSAWTRFMAGMDGPQKAGKGKDDGGMAAPFRKLADEGNKMAEAEASSDCFAQVGNFVDKQYFVTQSPNGVGSARASEPGWENCRQAATDIAIRYLRGEKPEVAAELGINVVGDLVRDSGYLRIIAEDKTHKSEVRGEKNESHPEWLDAHDQMAIALSYINEKLSQRIPVVIGVDHTFNRDLNAVNKPASKTGMGYNEGTTDHYITLTGADKDEAGRRYYSYFDVATAHSTIGTSAENRLVETSPGIFNRAKGAGAAGDQAYYLSMVLIYKNDRNRYGKEIEKNLDDKKAMGL